MEELIKSYGLNYKFFKVMLSAASGIIAGSSVLYEFLKLFNTMHIYYVDVRRFIKF